MNVATDDSTASRGIWLGVITSVFAVTCLPGLLSYQERTIASDRAHDASGWSSLWTPEKLHERQGQPGLVVIDVRSGEQYAAGHIPGAISLPGANWRTPPTKNPRTEGPGQRIFRAADGSLDVKRYEALLGGAGITADDEVVVYGNTAGKADGSLPAALLLKLGHRKVAFLDGVGLERWRAAGYPVATSPVKREPTQYVAQPEKESIWSYRDVLNRIDDKEVVIIDSRTPEEYAGKDLRGNRRGGHIPGALLLSSDDFLNKSNGTTISREEAKARIERLIPKGKRVVVYCQSGTRCSHEEIILRDLGYENVSLYDASWQEWGNREDTPVESGAPGADTPQADGGNQQN